MTHFVENDADLNFLIDTTAIERFHMPEMIDTPYGKVLMFVSEGPRIHKLGHIERACFPWRWTNLLHPVLTGPKQPTHNAFIGAAIVDGDGIVFDESFLIAGPFGHKAARSALKDLQDANIHTDGFTRMQVEVDGREGIRIHEILWLDQYYRWLVATKGFLNESVGT
jgi:hypothetical protein